MSSFDRNTAMEEGARVVAKGFLNKIGEIFVEKGGDALTALTAGDGITAVRVMQPVEVTGGPLEVVVGPLEVVGTLDARVVMTAPLKVDIQSVSTAIAVGVFGGWLIVKAAGAALRFFSRGQDPDI